MSEDWQTRKGGLVAHSRQQIHKLLKDSGRLFLAEHEGELWATDSYWIAPLSSVPAIENLLGWWNLAVEPGAYLVDNRVYANAKGSPPDIAPIIKWREKATEQIKPRTIAGYHVLKVRATSSNADAILFGTDDAPFGIRPDYLAIVVAEAPLDSNLTLHRIPGETLKPIWGKSGAVMPVRLK